MVLVAYFPLANPIELQADSLEADNSRHVIRIRRSRTSLSLVHLHLQFPPEAHYYRGKNQSKLSIG